MTAAPQTTVAALFYALPPAINFARLVADLDAALAGLPQVSRSITWDCDDVAMVDVDGARIVLGWADRLPGTLPACLAVSIGPGPGDGLPDRLTQHADAVASLIVGRIAARLPAASIVWDRVDGVMTAERLDGVIDALAAAGTVTDTVTGTAPPEVVEEAVEVVMEPVAHAMEPATDAAGEPAADADTVPLRADAAAVAGAGGPTTATQTDPAALDRLMARMERELHAARAQATEPAPADARAEPEPAPPAAPVLRAPARARRPDPAKTRNTGARARARARGTAAAAAAVANDLPDLPRPSIEEMARIRSALYPPHEAEPERASTPVRIAVGTMGATLVIVAAPVGAALLTYNALRGANLAVTARAVALTGAALGLMEMPVLRALLSFG
jgi:hypothetical protein